MAEKVELTEEEWRIRLTPAQFRVLREKGTERPGTGEYNKTTDTGVYKCVGCDADLYSYETKFDSGCGWPAFFAPIKDAVVEKTDSSYGMIRTEIVCAKCGGHLGHVFRGEKYNTPTAERHCVNSIALKLATVDQGEGTSKM